MNNKQLPKDESISAKGGDQQLDQRFSPMEQEVVFLRASIDLINAMANFEVLRLSGEPPFGDVQFQSGAHHKYFGILLVDFLSKIDKESLIGYRESHVDAFKSICSTPCFSENGSIHDLNAAVQDLSAWLDEEVDVSVRLPTLNANPTLTIKRTQFLWMCGNVSKHNLLNRGRVAKRLQALLKQAEVDVATFDALLALDDFYTRFHDDILLYHLSRIVELLNNIRWGIYSYLQPEHRRSFVPSSAHSLPCSYAYPSNMTSPFARECYWELMNEMRSPPYFRKYKVHEVMRRRY